MKQKIDTVSAIVKEYFPDATEDFIEHVLWGRTAFPAGTVSGTYEEDVRQACIVLKEAQGKGIELCDMCDRPAIINRLCESCYDTLHPKNAEGRI